MFNPNFNFNSSGSEYRMFFVDGFDVFQPRGLLFAVATFAGCGRGVMGLARWRIHRQDTTRFTRESSVQGNRVQNHNAKHATDTSSGELFTICEVLVKSQTRNQKISYGF